MSLNPIYPIIRAEDFTEAEMDGFKALDLDAMTEQLEGLFSDLANKPVLTLHHATLSPDKGSVFADGPEVWDYKALVTAYWTQGDQLFLYTSTGHTVNFTLLMSRMKDLQEELTKD